MSATGSITVVGTTFNGSITVSVTGVNTSLTCTYSISGTVS